MNNLTTILSTGSAVNVNSYFQLDLGLVEKSIKQIVIKPVITGDPATGTASTANCRISIIKTNGAVTYQYDTTVNDRSNFSVYFHDEEK